MTVHLINVGDLLDTAKYGGAEVDEIISTVGGGYKLIFERQVPGTDPWMGASEDYLLTVGPTGVPNGTPVKMEADRSFGPSKALADGSLLVLYGSSGKVSLGVIGASGTLKSFYSASLETIDDSPYTYRDGSIAYGSDGSIALARIGKDASGKYRTVDILDDGRKFVASVVLDRSVKSDEAGSTQVTALSDDRYVVTWAEPTSDGSNIVARIVTGAGKAVGTKFVIGQLDDLGTPAAIETRYRVTALDQGGFALSYQGEEYYSDPINPANSTYLTSDIAGQFWLPNASGGFTAGDAFYQDPSLSEGYIDSLITLSTGQLVQVVSSHTPTIHGRSELTIKGYIYDSNGEYTGNSVEFFKYVNDFVNHDFVDIVRAIALEDGKFALNINYESRVAGTHYGIQTYSISSLPLLAVSGATAGDDVLKGDTRRDRAELIKAGSGNDQLFGYGGNDKLLGGWGHDLLDGGKGADRMEGEGGNDTYVVDNFGDIIVEGRGAGTDTVKALIGYKLGDNVENLILIGKSAIEGTGNTAANVLTGNSAANVLDGGKGVDVMTGLGGNDTYRVDDAKDQVIEAAGNGTDTVIARVSYRLAEGQSVEVLRAGDLYDAFSFTPIDLTGNSGTNTLIGNDGANVLNGKGGADILTGSGGNDAFVFDTTLGSGSVDRITDFSSFEDTIRLDDAIFKKLALGGLAESAFKDLSLGTQDADDRILYNPETGRLSYDADGKGGTTAVTFAILGEADAPSRPVVTASDFLII